MENVVETSIVVSESAPETNGCCSECGSATLFVFDKKFGYYKQCPKCGSIHYLHRRFLRLNRHSRQWQ